MRGFQFVDNKAALKLDEVCKKMLALAGDSQHDLSPTGLLERTITMQDEFGDLCVILRYDRRSKLFAVLYNLQVEQFIESPCSCDARVAVNVSTRNIEVSSGDLSAELRERLEALVASDLFSKRLNQLDIVGVSFEGVANRGWRITLEPYVGSCTWNLIPPVMYLIEPSVGDCMRCVELLRMTASCFW